MINLEQAKELATQKLQEIQRKSSVKLSFLTDDQILEFEHGWVFFYSSEEFVRTGNEKAFVGGNAPIMVDREKALAIITGTRKRIEEYIRIYSEAKRTGKPLDFRS